VLHATPDVATSLAHTRTLLAPGGTLVLLEATTPQRFGDLTVGLLDGWWGFTDLERRQYALMPRERWLRTLGECGFAAPSVIVEDGDGPVLKQQAILIAQVPNQVAGRAPGHWLIVPDAAGAADALATALTAAGDESFVLPARAGALERAIDDATRRGTRITGVVHLAAIDIVVDDATPPSALWADQERLVRGALETVQTLAAAPWSEQPPTLWFITRGAQSTQLQEGSNPAQATVWGLSHVVAMEHPELRCRRVDLDAAASVDDSLPDLVSELHASSREDQVALRGKRRLLRRLVRRDAVTLPTIPRRLSAEHTYLVTGGLRGLGLRVAEWLVEQGARSLVLMGRRAPDAKAEGVIRRLEADGARVIALTGDVAREADVRAVLDEIARSMPTLRGIVHAAGVLDDGVVTAQSWARFATVMAPKVLGTWHLHRLTGALDFFVLFSSGAAIAGSPGQANHAAANAFEDAFACYRHAHGLATVSINWGPWAEVGAAADRSVSGPSFLRQIAPRDGLSALEIALRVHDGNSGSSRPHVAVLASDWSKVGGSDGLLLSPLFREVAAATRTAARSSTSPTAATETTLRERLRGTSINRRRAVLQDHVRTLTVRVLGIQPSETFDVREPLRQLGLDSLMAVELRNLLAKAADRAMPATITFDYPSVSALTDYLAADAFADELSVPGPAASNPERSDMSSTHTSVDDVLSGDELAARLAEKLDRMAIKERL
jgi:NAD(P)-dependent dehydrogenase (short-subunit alcohol dehydrogenase family)/acyl carrier protein